MIKLGAATYDVIHVTDLYRGDYQVNPNIPDIFMFCVPCNRYSYAYTVSKQGAKDRRVCILCHQHYF